MPKKEEEMLKPGSIGGLEITTVHDKPTFINMLVYGTPGAGKTVLAGSADAVVEMSPVLFIDVEGGTFSLRERYPDVDVVRVKTWKDLQRIYDELFAMKHKYKTVVLDSLSEIQKFSMYNIMTDLVSEHPDRDEDVPGMREWGKNIEQIRKFVRAYRDLPMHTIFTALSAADKNAKTGLMLHKPALSGKLAMEVGGFVDVLVYMYTKEVESEIRRLMLTTNTDEYVAKDRSDSLPPVVTDPDMATLYEYMFEDKKKQEQEQKQIEMLVKEEDINDLQS